MGDMDNKKRRADNLTASKQYEFLQLCRAVEFILQDCKLWHEFLKSLEGLPASEKQYKRKFMLAQVLNKLGVWP